MMQVSIMIPHFHDRNLTAIKRIKTDMKFKFSIPDLPRTGKQQKIAIRLSWKHKQICVCNSAVNPHRRFRTCKTVLVKFEILTLIV